MCSISVIFSLVMDDNIANIKNKVANIKKIPPIFYKINYIALDQKKIATEFYKYERLNGIVKTTKQTKHTPTQHEVHLLEIEEWIPPCNF